MKKLDWLCLLLISSFMLAPLSVMAEKYDWVDKSYDFTHVKRVMVNDLDISKTDLSAITAKVLKEDYRSKANDLSLQLISPAPKSSPTLAQLTDIYIDAELLAYQHDQAFVPAHTEWRTDYRDDIWYNREGRPHVYSDSYQYPVFINDHYIPAATVSMRFNVYDAKTGQPVFSREEARTRGSSNDVRGVYDRIIDAFYKTIRGKIKS